MQVDIPQNIDFVKLCLTDAAMHKFCARYRKAQPSPSSTSADLAKNSIFAKDKTSLQRGVENFLIRHNLGFQRDKNKAFVRLGSCDNVQTERSIFEYANWPKLGT